MKTHNHPKHLARPRSNEFSKKARLSMGLKRSEKHREHIPVTLKKPPWEQKKPVD